MRKTIDKQEIIDCMKGAIESYETITGKKIDQNNGYSQVPKDNLLAMYWYGRFDMCRSLLEIGKY